MSENDGKNLPAMPLTYKNTTKETVPFMGFDVPPETAITFSGLSERQYAAIHLKVPDTGDQWLDDMIRESLRTDLSARLICSLLSNHDAFDALDVISTEKDYQEKLMQLAKRIADDLAGGKK